MKCVLYKAIWCKPCHLMEKIFNRIAATTEGVDFVSVDIDKEPELASKYSVSSIPMILFLKDEEVVSSLVGLHKEADIKSVIDGLIKRG